MSQVTYYYSNLPSVIADKIYRKRSVITSEFSCRNFPQRLIIRAFALGILKQHKISTKNILIRYIVYIYLLFLVFFIIFHLSCFDCEQTIQMAASEWTYYVVLITLYLSSIFVILANLWSNKTK